MGFFQVIMFPFAWFFAFLYELVNNYGVAIIIFTLITRLLMIPLGIKQQKSLIKQAKFAPRLQELQKIYGDNKQKLSEEQMKLYQEEGFNPAGGCLPVLIQLPLMLILYNVIINPFTTLLGKTSADVGLLTQHLFGNSNKVTQIALYGKVAENWATDSFLQANFPELVNFNFLGLDLTVTPSFSKPVYLIVPLLAMLTGLALSLITQKSSSVAQPQQSGGSQWIMMLLSPVMTVIFTFTFPSGIGLYWIIGNIFAIFQAILLNKFLDPKAYLAKLETEAAAKKEAAKVERRSRMTKKKEERNPQVVTGDFTEVKNTEVADNNENQE